MNENPVSSKREGQNGKRPNSAFLGVMRFILLLIVGTILGTALYFVGLFVYQNLVVQPAQFNTFRLDMLETRQAQAQAQNSDRLTELSQRLTDLETQRALDAETISGLQTDMQSIQGTLDQQSLTLSHITDLQNDLNAFSQQISQTNASFATLEATLTADHAPLAILQQEVQILRVMELLSRSRLYLLQNNLGLAEEDVKNARQVLSDLKGTLSANQQEVVTSWIQRIDLALANLPFSPVIASDDLEIVWRLLVSGLPEEGQTAALTPLSALPSPLPPTPTPTLTPTPTFTPTSVPTQTITSTP